jgi:ornithine--oxo-acid transaminase
MDVVVWLRSLGLGKYEAAFRDLLSGFGVFALSRNHPVLREALKSVLDNQLPNLVQMDVSTLAFLCVSRTRDARPRGSLVCI